MVRGWLLDLYPLEEGKIVVWIKSEDNRAIRLVDSWHNSIYVAADQKSLLLDLVEREEIEHFIVDRAFERKFERIVDLEKSEVLRLTLKDARRSQDLAKIIQSHAPFDVYRIYNADVSPQQAYFYEKELFPLALVEAEETNGHIRWKLLDSVEATDYEIPKLSSLRLRVDVDKQRKLPTFDDRIKSIQLISNDRGSVTLDEGSEADKIRSLVKSIRKLDPDLIHTDDGDTFTLLYLIKRAEENHLQDQLILSREQIPLKWPKKLGNSYFSYGKILYKPASQKLYGRVHVDESNTFIASSCGLHGLIEVARLCRIPIHTALRASIGKCMSSLQFYNATKRDILIPWKATLAECFKTVWDLMVADRGGFVFEPKLGLHEEVGEIDFSSLYPTIMAKKNISAETISCRCCEDSTLIVPEVNYHVCQRRRGIVPISLDLVLEKRRIYKELMKRAADPKLRQVYDARQASLKWILVCCLPRESLVLIQRNGHTRYVKIGYFIDSLIGDKVGIMDCPSDIFVAGLDRDLKARFCKIRKLVKIPNHSRLLGVTMDDGRRIAATSDHPFFLLKEGELKVRPAEALKKGDLIPVAKRIPISAERIKTIDLIEQLEKVLECSEQFRWKVYGSTLKGRIAVRKQPLVEEAVREGYTRQAVNAWIKSGIIPLRFFRLLDFPPELHKNLRVGIGRRLGGRTSWLPAVLPINEEFGFFLGLYVSDGSATNTYVRIDIGSSEKDLLKNAREVVKSLFQTSPRIYRERKARMYVLQINNLALVQFLERVLDLPGSAEKGKLKVPNIIFNSNALATQGFLEGLVAGDGTVSKTRNFVNIATVSKEFVNQLGFLAAGVSLGFTISAHSRRMARPLYTISFVGPETLQKIVGWRFLKLSHRRILEPKVGNLCKRDCAHPLYQMFPTEESGLLMLARAARTVRSPRMDRRLSSCPNRVAQTIKKIDEKKLDEELATPLEKLHRMFESDLGFVRVREVKELERNDEHVYCFQVDDSELPGFFTGEGAVYTHNCFGYLGFNNAKFGRIDAHISVCAYARKILLDAVRIAERNGFSVVHGIVDSLWLKKRGSDEGDYESLCEEIRDELCFPISFEGIYRWIAFLSSKVYNQIPVLNRYFGVFRSGEVKQRGIETRRHDTPTLITRFQEEVLQTLAKSSDIQSAYNLLPSVLQILRSYANLIKEGRVPLEDLVIQRGLSKNLDEYENNTLQAIAARQLQREGRQMFAGQTISYIITDYYSKNPENRVLAYELITSKTRYDVVRYLESLAYAASTILEPFGYSKECLEKMVFENPSRTTVDYFNSLA